MSAIINENTVEQAALAYLSEIGYTVIAGKDIAPDGVVAERANYSEVFLAKRLQAAITELNPDLPTEAREEVFNTIVQNPLPSLIEENRRLHQFIIEGVPVTVMKEDGTPAYEQAQIINFDIPDANNWLAVSQFTVIEGKAEHRADVVIFINGMPLAAFELKNPVTSSATLDSAFNQLQNYKTQIPSLFYANAALVISDGVAARIGSLTANFEWFMQWRTVDGKDLASGERPEQEILIKGVFEHHRFLDWLKNFIVFADSGDGIKKIVAGYHQFYAVRKAVKRSLPAIADGGDRKVGVIWHTQGAGKSLLMIFYAGIIVRHPAMENPTLVVITDRNNLDEQLFGTFSMCRDLLRQTPQQADSCEHLRVLLNNIQSGGVIFTTLQKFGPIDNPEKIFTTRRNVIVIADEAHRSQYGLEAKFTHKGEISYGFAKRMRDALPNASFIGFTGTPIENADINTPALFGDYIDVYDIGRAVQDKVTVPIYYESRLARVALDENQKVEIDAEIETLTEHDTSEAQESAKRKWANLESVVGSERRLQLITQDIAEHFERRLIGLDGKAMIVCMSRRICVALYEAFMKLRPQWCNEDDQHGAIKVVMTGNVSDSPEWLSHIGNRPKERRELLTKRFKDPKDPMKIVIVCDMWLTGFDAPCLHTMYVDKPMKQHGLMQAITRVNRVFRDKPAGLVVDYIGIAQNLQTALGQYSPDNHKYIGIDETEAVFILKEKYEIVKSMFHPTKSKGFDYHLALDPATSAEKRLEILSGAMNWILMMQQSLAAQETSLEMKKRAHRIFADAVAALSKAFSLVAASDWASNIREEVGFFQTVRALLTKNTLPVRNMSLAERDFAVQQIVNRAVISTEIVDILQALGLNSPNIAILSDEFLAEIREIEQKNLAVEALKKLFNDQVRAQVSYNVIQARTFLERLEASIARYHANAITTTEMLDELIEMAKEFRAAQKRGEENGLNVEEIAFYDALAENGNVREVMGEPKLIIIAHELVTAIKANITVDWTRREEIRAAIRVVIKRLLRKYEYPPDLQNEAMQSVLRQAEAMASRWAA